MLSKEDFKEYLEQAKTLESNMLHLYKRCESVVEDENMRKVFDYLLKSEANHDIAIKNVIKLIDA